MNEREKERAKNRFENESMFAFWNRILTSLEICLRINFLHELWF